MIKTKRNRKWIIAHTGLDRRILPFSSYKDCKLNVKLWWLGARERKNRTFLVLFILSVGNFFNICVLSQCIVYWIHFQNIHTFTYLKTFLHTLLLLAFKIVESLQCILNSGSFLNSFLRNLDVMDFPIICMLWTCSCRTLAPSCETFGTVICVKRPYTSKNISR